ncbi:hypothetical protein [Daejeonella sp. H1SJ63]|uniref:hypothetical protein n=1 Tax=Daejeonella sp. H1SJ63 TaxID=3034145 RepID=UPI0023ECD089|nr:hypothetical protein [Daejeonella sp. H1SJ63]
MLNLEVKLNGRNVAIAGMESLQGVMSVIVMTNKKLGQDEEVTIDVSGLNTETQSRLEWFSSHLQLGDEIAIKILEGDRLTYEANVITLKDMEKRNLEHKIMMYNKLKEELKDVL